MPEAARVRRPALLWAAPAALALVLGIALAGWGAAYLPDYATRAGSVALALLYALALLLARRPWLLLCALFVPVGFERYALWEARPRPLEPLLGVERSFSGESDGVYLTLDEPAGARVVLSPRGVVGVGRASLVGTLREASGKRNPGGFDYRGYLQRRGVEAQLRVAEVTAFTPTVTLKGRLQRGVEAGLAGERAALLSAMTLGVRDDLGELRMSFAAAGLAHVLALSGLHVGVLLGAAGLLLRPLGTLRYPLLLALTAAFVLLVGASPSVLRAGVMAGAVLVSLWFGAGRLEPWPALALAALVTLLLNPSFLFDLSFQLSYGSVMGILLFAGPTLRRLLGARAASLAWWHPGTLLVGGAVVSASAQALTLPFVAHHFNLVPLFGPLVNVVAVPLATLLVPLGFLAGLAGLVSLPLAEALGALASPLAGAMIAVSALAAPWPQVTWGELEPIGFLYFGVGALAAALVAQGRLRPWRGLLVVAAAMIASSLTPPFYGHAELVFFDVGQGDSALIRLPGRVEILVDGGGTPFSDFDVGARTVVPALRALGVDELELVIATHDDADHIEGLVSVLERVPVQHLLVAHPSDKAVFRELIATAERRGVPVTEVRRGQRVHVGAARLDILNPPKRPYGESNADSVAFVLNVAGAPQALFLGDAPAEVEAALAVPRVPVLMAAHHGSRFSTSEALLLAAQPEVAVLSYGRNNYGHPHPDVLARLEAAGAQVRHTYLEGAVRLPLSKPLAGDEP
ncbi:DNA internalization-related competence protein ComEC/Rec2 [Truepera radiovictrix]|uniref:DNA internalization-related competence protein ComEC/Rec2 n=1 Tax=Truepera radiovictrix TaxID=332249 RepID=UPI001620EEBD|nr:DNA internalization-related competence protein ComEC/Rec2 [Truepera radiovictrix]WMT57749.1 DNA internalization-related competence protein ComEC/Rec2 [Truepera radiovictrix]